MLTLTGDVFYISPYFFSCFVALREKELEFETQTLALYAREQDKGDYAAKTLTGRIPSLTHDEIVIAESSAIIEYLEEAFPKTKRVMPTNTADRARARQVMSWIRSDDTLPIRTERPTTSMFYEPIKKPMSDACKRSVDKLVALAERLLGVGTDNIFADWTLVDSELAFMLKRLTMNNDAVPYPLQAFADKQWNRGSVREFVVRERPAYVPY